MTVLLGQDITTIDYNLFGTGSNVSIGYVYTGIADGTATEAVIDIQYAGSDFIVCVYDAAENLLASGRESNSTTGDQVVTLDTPVAITQGTSYRLAVYSSGAMATGRDNSVGQTWQMDNVGNTYPTIPDPFSSDAGTNEHQRRFFLQGTTGPTITNITNPITTGGTATITGTGFGATQGSSTVTQDGIALTATSWSDTSIDVTTVDVESSALKYGTHTFEVTVV